MVWKATSALRARRIGTVSQFKSLENFAKEGFERNLSKPTIVRTEQTSIFPTPPSPRARKVWSTPPVRITSEIPEHSTVPNEPKYFTAAVNRKYDPLWLRDVCDCPLCIDPSTKQKLFQTSDIPASIEIATDLPQNGQLYRVLWKNDIPGYPNSHVSTFNRELLYQYRATNETLSGHDGLRSVGDDSLNLRRRYWTRKQMETNARFMNYDKYMSSDATLLTALKTLRKSGLLFLKGVPNDEKSVESVVSRIGHLRETFYGRTWDVKSVPNAKNVAYTNRYLGFHMDLLYTSNPPGLQLLHCLKNSCEGGSSMFSDSFNAVQKLRDSDVTSFKTLQKHQQTFHYRNDNQHYLQMRPVIEWSASKDCVEFVNWSPPFQGPFLNKLSHSSTFRQYVSAAQAFARIIEAPENIYEYRLQEGECVIFDNRRVLHARRAFQTNEGERWLKGAYIDTDVYLSRLRALVAEEKHTHNAHVQTQGKKETSGYDEAFAAGEAFDRTSSTA